MKHILITSAVLAVATVTALPAPAHAQTAGYYNIEGGCPGTNRYRGTLTITGRGPVYYITWQTAGDVSRGKGLEQNGTMAVWFVQGGKNGVLNAQRRGNDWYTTWSLGQNGAVCDERWIRRR